jgi:hypothetical protein
MYEESFIELLIENIVSLGIFSGLLFAYLYCWFDKDLRKEIAIPAIQMILFLFVILWFGNEFPIIFLSILGVGLVYVIIFTLFTEF